MTTIQSDLPIGHELIEGQPHHAVTVYGTDWCGDSTRARALLQQWGIEFNYYNIDLDPAMERTAWSLQPGTEKTPVVRIDETHVLIEPSDDVLLAALRETGRIA